MPELPEVETTRRGLAPHVVGRAVAAVEVREPRLRWPVPPDLAERLRGRRIDALERRAKYLLFAAGTDTLLVHLGMSGSLKFLPRAAAHGTHDHVDVHFEGGGCLRFTDPRRFGSFHLTSAPAEHPLLRALGPEPFAAAFDADYLWRTSRGRKVAIKQHLMNGHVVVGVGNIYASEALHLAHVRPTLSAARISRPRADKLRAAIRDVLGRALAAGGTTLRNYSNAVGERGNFQFEARVYDRAGEPCTTCGSAIRLIRQGQRATYYCPSCQKN